MATRSIGRRNDADRAAWVSAQLEALPAGWRLLDVGAGELRFRPACAHLHYVSQDFGRYDGRGDGAGLQTGTFDQSGIDLVCDVMDVPEPDGSFDAILCTEVLEHVPDPIGAVREMARLLRPGGRLILTAPFVSFTHFSPYHFHTGFARYWYEHWLPRLGFAVITLEPAGDDGFFDFLAQEIGRIPAIWRRYSHLPVIWTGLLAVVGRLADRIARPFLSRFHAWSDPSIDFYTHRWCCVAERAPPTR